MYYGLKHSWMVKMLSCGCLNALLWYAPNRRLWLFSCQKIIFTIQNNRQQNIVAILYLFHFTHWLSRLKWEFLTWRSKQNYKNVFHILRNKITELSQKQISNSFHRCFYSVVIVATIGTIFSSSFFFSLLDISRHFLQYFSVPSIDISSHSQLDSLHLFFCC